MKDGLYKAFSKEEPWRRLWVRKEVSRVGKRGCRIMWVERASEVMVWGLKFKMQFAVVGGGMGRREWFRGRVGGC